MMTLIAVAGAWTLLALFAGELRRQHNDIEQAAKIAARKAEREAMAAADAAELIARAKSSASRSPFRPAR